MTSIREPAPAKINLTLEIAGRRPDGLHEVASLVAFAGAGDVVTLDPDGAPSVVAAGPFAGALQGPNILDGVLALLEARAPQLQLGAVRVEKHLPVAAGLGGGSADAAALLRAVRRASGAASAGVDWHGLAADLGADVPVCLESRPRWMTGAGHELAEVAGGPPPLDAVLVNPMADVPADKTAQVFRALAAGPLGANHLRPLPPVLADRSTLLAFMRARGNDLTRAACAVVPEVGAVLAALSALKGIEYAAVSGAGPTCFGIFPDAAAADAGRLTLATRYPTWWVVTATLG